MHESFEINMYITSRHLCRKDQWIILKINIFTICSEELITVDRLSTWVCPGFTLLGDTLGASTNGATRSSSMTAHTIPSIPVSPVLCTSHVWQSVLKLRTLQKCDKKYSAIARHKKIDNQIQKLEFFLMKNHRIIVNHHRMKDWERSEKNLVADEDRAMNKWESKESNDME